MDAPEGGPKTGKRGADPAGRLLPHPATLERTGPGFRIDGSTPIRANPAMDDDGGRRREGRALQDRLRERIRERTDGRAAPAETPSTDPSAPAIRLHLAPDSGLPSDGFRLSAGPAGAVVEAGSRSGLAYGAETLAQLVGPDGSVPGARIEDRPALARRGFLLDVSRGRVPTMASLRDLVTLLSRLRYNELYLYIEHTFAFERHPEIGAGSGALAADGIRELDAFARELHVDLVPCLQTFGHMRRILEKDRYRRLAETDRLWSVSPEAPGTYPLLEDMLGEFLPCFSSSWAHVNCDEPVDLGRGRSRARAERDGPARLFADHVNRVAGMVRDHGKRPMIWADVLAEHPDALGMLDEDIVACDWWYEADHDFDRVRTFREAGRRFLCVAGTSSWTSLFPRLPTALPNIRGHALAAKRHRADGFILTDWGDGGHYNLFGGSLHPIAFAAEEAWRGEDRPARPESAVADAFSEHVAGDRSGFAGRFARVLGRCHRTGFPHFNHSPLKTVFFETRLSRGRRVPDESALRETGRRLDVLADAAAAAGLPDGAIGTDWRYALEASRLAVERGLLALRVRRADRAPGGLGRKAARELASALRALASRQAALVPKFREAWLRGNRPEGIETALDLHRRAASALRSAARRIERRSGGEEG